MLHEGKVMGVKTVKLIGGPGTGKTRALLNFMDDIVAEVGDPRLVGFSSYTRAARREASTRAGDRFSLRPVELEHSGWIKTLHAACYRLLGVRDRLLTDCKADREWLQEQLQESVHLPTEGGEPYAESFAVAGEAQDADRALTIWDAARNRLVPLATVWRERDETDDRSPALDYCTRVVSRYEMAKRVDGRVDFTDLIAQFAGYGFSVEEGAYQTAPRGEPPSDVEAWLLDEQQDSSALQAAATQRLVSGEDVRQVVLCGDPFQSIYGWAGADASHFLTWPVDETVVMDRSYRCAADILALGEQLISGCSDYFPRGISPTDTRGEISDSWLPIIGGEIDPRDEWLILARTNWHARRIGRLLDTAAIPWTPTRGHKRGGGGVQVAAIEALLSIQHGGPVDGWQWQQILKQQIPTAPYFERGTKSHFSSMEGAAEVYPFELPGDLHAMGATALFLEVVCSGQWTHWIPGSDHWIAARARWGEDLVREPRVRVGTVHSAKGAQADNVAILTSISRPCALSARSDAGRDEEQRVKYVATTRARNRLLIVKEQGTGFRWRME